MKSSTRKSSFEVANVRGIIFFTKVPGKRFITLQAWEAAGFPSDCFIYDNAHALLEAKIPIVDAIEVENRWIRAPLNLQNCSVRVSRIIPNPAKIKRTSQVELKPSKYITAEDQAGRKIR